MKKIGLLAFVLVLLSTAVVVGFVRPAVAEETIYIRADGSVEGTDKIQRDGNIYTFTDNIHDAWLNPEIVVERSNIIIDGNGYGLQGNGYGHGFYLLDMSNVTIKNTYVRAFDWGVYLSESTNNTISGNDITASNWDGISLEGSSNNTVSGNTIANNLNGIVLYNSSNNTVSGNTIIDNGSGIELSHSSNNHVYHNDFKDNTEQVYLSESSNTWDDGYPSGGNYWSDYNGTDLFSGPYQNETGSDGIGDTPYFIDADNQDRYPLMHPWNPLPVYNINTGLGYATIQEAINANETLDGHTIFVREGTYYEHVAMNKSITLIGENRDRTIIDGSSTGTVMNITANHVNVTGFTIRKSGSHPDCGIYVPSSFNNISYNIIKNCPAYAIELRSSSNNIISGNVITSNAGAAVYLYALPHNSSNNIISENNITNNEHGIFLSGSGLGPDYSSNNTIVGNNIVNNSETGISLYRSPGNIISRNNITNNTRGIKIHDYPSTNNTIYENDIANNTYGIELIGSGNKIYHNNFIDNTQQASMEYGSTQPNVWDDGYPSGGNYWSDYTGVDANGDGIGDTPYIINANNKDRYPLMNIWTQSWAPPEQPPPTPTEVQVGVKAGDWIKIDYTITGWPAGTPYPLWLKVEFLSVEGTSATVRVTMRMSDGTEQNATVPVDVVAGGGAFQGLSGFVIPANCTTGDSIYMSGYGNVTIAGETTGSYAGAGRTVVYASFSQYGTQLTYHWDKLTGAMVEASVVSGGVTATGKATETNMWQAAPSGLPIEPIYLYILAALVIIIVVGATAFLVRRKKKPPEEVENSQSKLRLTRTGFKRNFGHRITRV